MKKRKLKELCPPTMGLQIMILEDKYVGKKCCGCGENFKTLRDIAMGMPHLDTQTGSIYCYSCAFPEEVKKLIDG